MRGRLRCAAAGLVLAVGCTSAPPPPPQFSLDYVGGVVAPQHASVDATLGVATLSTKPFYNRQRVAWRDGAEHNYHAVEWEDVPRQLLAEAVVDAARAQNAFSTVVRHPASWGGAPLVVVRGRVVAFDDVSVDRTREARVAVRVVLTDASGRRTLWKGLIAEARPIDGSDNGAMVDAFRAAQAAVADAIVAHARRVGREEAAKEQAAATE